MLQLQKTHSALHLLIVTFHRDDPRSLRKTALGGRRCISKGHRGFVMVIPQSKYFKKREGELAVWVQLGQCIPSARLRLPRQGLKGWTGILGTALN